MFPRSITHVFERANQVFARTKDAHFESQERTAWMNCGAVLANARALFLPAEVTVSSVPFGYWRGMSMRSRASLENALLSRGVRLCAWAPRYEVSAFGIGREQILERVVRRMIGFASVDHHKAIEIVRVTTRKRCGLTFVHVIAQPLHVQSANREVAESRRMA